jgi:hypothetical protein
MAEQDKWKWQEPGTAWRGICTYHITLTIPSREPLLGTLVIPDGDPAQARVERTALGNAVVDELYVMCRHYPAIRILQFCLMPDHLHAIIRVTQVMDTSIRSVIRGYWQGVKKLGRAYTLSVSPASGPSPVPPVSRPLAVPPASGPSSVSPVSRPLAVPPEFNSGPTPQAPTWPFPIFTERPFIRPLSRRGQLHTMMRYVQMNPQRLATKRLKPGFFHVQRDITIHGRSYDGVGNTMLLMAQSFAPVHVRSVMVAAAEHGETESLRNYMNSCVLKARQGVVMVSPFISTQEKMVMQVLLREQRPFIILLDNGFRDFFKPSDALFDACALGRVLLLSPWPYDATKRHISRADCVALNQMAEEICNM